MRPALRNLLLAAIAVAAAAPAASQLRVEKRADLSLPVALGPKQGAILVGFRRPDPMSQGKHGVVAFARYDLEHRDMVFQPKGAKKSGDTTTYWVQAQSGDKNLASDYALMVVSAGDYVMFGATPGGKEVLSTFCLGAPAFHVGAGEIVYFGDLTPYPSVRLVDGTKAAAMAYSSHPDDARAALAHQPALAAGLRPAELRNKATYACAGQAMTAYEVPGIPELEAPAPAPAGEAN
ncbi:MAG: hypothetical protein JWO81_469 [Alphaproteobacteria bacterium]|nr:hypothetical protein [Alphaproteobacteria bacterium]